MPFVARFGTNKKPKRAMRCSNRNIYKKTKTSNQRHLPVLVFETELILSRKQKKTSNEEQHKATNSKWKHAPKPKRATKSNKEHFSFPFSFICFNSDLWKVVDINSNEKPERATTNNQPKATKSSKKQRRATKSKNRQRKWKNQNGQ